jgi:hypothetical protein
MLKPGFIVIFPFVVICNKSDESFIELQIFIKQMKKLQ